MSASAFRETEKAFRLYKDGRPSDPTLLQRVIDFASDPAADLVERREPAESAPAWLKKAQIFSIRGMDGFRFIRCPLDHGQQLQLAGAALRQWIEPPSATNLVVHHPGPHTNLWERHQLTPHNSLLSRLTWATLGYQYQWTQRAYVEDKRSPLPQQLEALSRDLAAACGWCADGPIAYACAYACKLTTSSRPCAAR